MPDTESPWGDTVDAQHIGGEYWYIPKWSTLWWTVAAILCLAAPPAGVFLVVFFVSSSIHHADDEVELHA